MGFGPVELKSQVRSGQGTKLTMYTLCLEWNGAERNNEPGIYLEPDFGTSYGVCSWITPFFRMPEEGKELDFNHLAPGSLSGENHGLSFLLDAETFDYVTGLSDHLGTRAGEGFYVALVHPFDMPIIQQMTINVMPGAITQIATSINIINITSTALDFTPKDRKCWMDEEIALSGFNYSDGYRYTMNNCLYEASMQAAYKNCSCYPGER